MNPLSAVGGYLQQLTRPDKVAQPALENIGTSAIPAGELEKLSPGITPLPNNLPGSSGASFEGMVRGLVGEVQNSQAAASATVGGLIAGQNVSLHQAMIGMEEANVSFQLMVEVRNKLLDSYQELMRMQI